MWLSHDGIGCRLSLAQWEGDNWGFILHNPPRRYKMVLISGVMTSTTGIRLKNMDPSSCIHGWSVFADHAVWSTGDIRGRCMWLTRGSRGDIDFDQNPNKIRGESIPAKTSKSQHRPNESMMDATRCESPDARSVEVLVVITTMFGHPRQKEKH